MKQINGIIELSENEKQKGYYIKPVEIEGFRTLYCMCDKNGKIVKTF
jgi:hypothetical protein